MNARLPLVLACVLAAGAAAPLPAHAEKVCAWSIPVEMLDTVESAKAKSGTPFRFRVTTDAARDDGVKIPAGSTGYGIIRSASSAGRHNHDGSLSLEPRYIEVQRRGGAAQRIEVTMNPNLPVTWTPREPLLNKAASHVPLPVPGLVMSGVNTVRFGRNITLGPGFTFTVLPVGSLAGSAPVC